ncbi:MAG: hypothetical protein LBJ84_06170 [Oscillospiraceae bacterium]|jgi:hypothetical protein|nr:hypothetical protein [Oscillospiraceae bacterium]
MEFTIFFAAALAMCLKDTADMRRDRPPRDISVYFAALIAAVSTAAALMFSRNNISIIRVIAEIFA